MAVFSKIGYGGAIFLDTSDDGNKDLQINMNNLTFKNCRAPSKGGCIFQLTGKRRNFVQMQNIYVENAFAI